MKMAVYIIITITVSFLLIFLRYRLTKTENITEESEITYKVIDIGQNDIFRNFFESLFRKKRVFLKEKFNTIEWLYIDNKDFLKLLPENPLTIKEKNYTIKFKFKTKRLIFGGFSVSKIISYTEINKIPEILK